MFFPIPSGRIFPSIDQLVDSACTARSKYFISEEKAKIISKQSYPTIFFGFLGRASNLNFRDSHHYSSIVEQSINKALSIKNPDDTKYTENDFYSMVLHREKTEGVTVKSLLNVTQIEIDSEVTKGKYLSAGIGLIALSGLAAKIYFSRKS